MWYRTVETNGALRSECETVLQSKWKPGTVNEETVHAKDELAVLKKKKDCQPHKEMNQYEGE